MAVYVFPDAAAYARFVGLLEDAGADPTTYWPLEGSADPKASVRVQMVEGVEADDLAGRAGGEREADPGGEAEGAG
jgi:hypothetical protein